MTVTVFTPSYNRAYILPKLYESLRQQTCKDFEWLIVDDGSSDNTEELVRAWQNEKQFNIRFFKQKNGGKHRAINRGVTEAHGELFFIVDSDDTLVSSAVERILYHYDKIQGNRGFGGIAACRAYPNGLRIGGELTFATLDCSCLEFRHKYKIKGDLAEIVRTSVMKEYPFPDIPNEKFCTEALLWDRISEKYNFRFINEKIYICQYLNDGLTTNMTRIRMNSPQYAMLYYSELFHRKISVPITIKAAINYYRFALCTDKLRQINWKRIDWGILFFPFAFIMHINDKVKVNRL